MSPSPPGPGLAPNPARTIEADAGDPYVLPGVLVGVIGDVFVGAVVGVDVVTCESDLVGSSEVA
jgi:hypothetical protein